MKNRFFALVAIIQIIFLFTPTVAVNALFFSSPSSNVRKEIKDFLNKDLLIDDNDMGVGQSIQKTLVPEVTLTFTKIDDTHYRATAQPKGITNSKEAYYTWYIRNTKDNHLRGFKPAGSLPLADQIGSAGFNPDDPEFWKIMATREMIKYHFDPMRYDSTFNGGNGDFNLDVTEYANNNDDDGYTAIEGGDNANDGDKYCYLYDRKNGEVYELQSGGSSASASDVLCPAGFEPICLDDNRITCPDPNNGANTVLYDQCTDQGSPTCQEIGPGVSAPLCSGGGTPFCIASSYSGTNRCPMVGEALPQTCANLNSSGTVVPPLGCNPNIVFSGNGGLNNACDANGIHLFVNPVGVPNFGGLVGHVTGDGDFDDQEEMFWGTDPENDNTVPGFLDEEVVVGKGMATFTWEYHEGDEVGVVVEGTGNPTRHDDRSMQTVFAFMPEGCEPIDTGSYVENVRGKGIEIFTTDMDRDNLNECLKDNFASPGGTKEELTLDVKISGPDNKIVPRNENELFTLDSIISHKGSDLDVSTERHNTNFEWFVEHSYSKTSGFVPITDKTFLKNQFGILNSEGIGVDSFTMSQNFPNTGGPVTNLNPNGDWFARTTDLSRDQIKDKGWVRITLRVNAPSARGDVSRFGQTSYLFQISDSGNEHLKLAVAEPIDATATGYKKQLDICGGPGEYLNCDVLVNQVIRVELPSPAMTSKNTIWKVNGKSVFCNEFIDPQCKPNNTSVIYVPIVKDVDRYNITATLSELGTLEASHAPGGSSANIAGTIEFNAVLNKITPELLLTAGGSAAELERGDKVDLTGVATTEISHNLFLVPRGSSATVNANFIPSFLTIGPEAHLEWYINSIQQVPGDVLSITFSSERDVSVKANGYYDISPVKRLALKNIYGITADISGRTFFDETVKVEIEDPVAGPMKPSNKIFATISQNSPVYLMFLLKMIFMIGIILFIPSVILSLSKKNN